LLTAAVEIPNSRPALLRLPLLARTTKKPSSAGWMPVLTIVNLKLKPDSLSSKSAASQSRQHRVFL
jgi:hypothetical protein